MVKKNTIKIELEKNETTTDQSLTPKLVLRSKLRNKKALITSAAVLVLLTVGASTYYLINNKQDEPSQTKPQHSIVGDNDKREDEDLGKITYTDTDLNFSFEYPAGWEFGQKDEEAKSVLGPDDIKILSLHSPDLKIKQIPYSRDLIENGAAVRVTVSYTDDEDHTRLRSFILADLHEPWFEGMRQTTISGEDAILYRVGEEVVAEYIRSGFTYRIEYTLGNDAKEYRDEFDAIVESFQSNDIESVEVLKGVKKELLYTSDDVGKRLTVTNSRGTHAFIFDKARAYKGSKDKIEIFGVLTNMGKKRNWYPGYDFFIIVDGRNIIADSSYRPTVNTDDYSGSLAPGESLYGSMVFSSIGDLDSYEIHWMPQRKNNTVLDGPSQVFTIHKAY